MTTRRLTLFTTAREFTSHRGFLTLAMSTPRKNDRVSLARHIQPHSPFGRAADSNYEFDPDTSHFPTSSKRNGNRPRHNYRTSTLAGAYRAVSRTSMSDDAALGLSSSPRRTREFANQRSPMSDESNPPEELLDVYRRIEEDGTLADFVPPYDDWDAQVSSRQGGRLSRASSRARERDHEAELQYDGQTFSEASFFDGTGDHSLRAAKRTADYTRDEQRLRRVTGKDSPIFSKAKAGSRAALTADNLQRREEQEAQEQHVPEDDGERGPSLNVPRTWGSRATRRQDWLRNVSGSTASELQEKKKEQEEISHDPPSRGNTEASAVSRPVRSSRTAERSNIPVRKALGERSANSHAQETRHEPREDKTDKPSSLDQNAPSSDGAAIPNTPIVVFKNSAFTRPGTTKRDSQDLLRKLSRTESPKLDSVKTPDPPKLFERKIYDKTPRVTGAWIDTPMTERVTELPSDLTKDIVPPAAPQIEAGDSDKEAKAPADAQPKSEETDTTQVTTNESPSESPPTNRSRPPLIRPKLPKSALETVIEDVRSGKDTMDMGDDTIESLHAIMDDPVELKTEEEEEEAYAKEILKRLEQANSNNAPSVDLDRLNDKLSSLAQNISAVKSGLNRLEEHVVRDGDIVTRPNSPGRHGLPKLQFDDFAMRSDGRLYAAIPLPQLWKRNPASQRIQLTKLGWLTLFSLSWYVVECIMCEEYCHPAISDTCGGYCLQPNAPVFPWVTVTMLWRWSHLSTFLTPVITIGVAFFRLMAQLLGLWDGYVDEGPSTQLGNMMGEIRINGTPVSFPWLSPPPAKTFEPAPAQLSQPRQPETPVWTPRDETPGGWEEEQASMDDDEYL